MRKNNKLTIGVSLLAIMIGLSVFFNKPESNEHTGTVPEVEEELVEKQIATPFILKAADGYVNHDNYTTPHTYVVDTYQNEVYVDVYEEPSGLTPEEIIENAKNADEEESIYPIYEVESLSAKEDSFTLQFDSKTVEFTALSESYYENEEGVRYILEPHSGIDKYIESFFD